MPQFLQNCEENDEDVSKVESSSLPGEGGRTSPAWVTVCSVEEEESTIEKKGSFRGPVDFVNWEKFAQA